MSQDICSKVCQVIFIHVYFWNYTFNCLLCGTPLELYAYISHVDTSRKPATLSNVLVCSLLYRYLNCFFSLTFSPRLFMPATPWSPHCLHCRIVSYFPVPSSPLFFLHSYISCRWSSYSSEMRVYF